VRTDQLTKRAFDVVIALTLLLLTLPVLVIALVGSAISLRAWPLFTQQRVGAGGELFTFVKVRTLPPETPAYADKYQLRSVRQPWFTQLLRKLHLDELPQLLLVLTGRMSLVGPRPELPNLHAELDPAFAELRTSVRPGCTGPWQVSTERDGLIGESPAFDAYYVERRSFGLDLWVLGRTARQMVGIGNPIRLEELPGPAPVLDLRSLELDLESAAALGTRVS
jgi:lipopolysaccharide/colanic/teichoic acid biosynthesis glycosyltransferase